MGWDRMGFVSGWGCDLINGKKHAGIERRERVLISGRCVL